LLGVGQSVSLAIASNGTTIDVSALVSVEIRDTVGRRPHARLVLMDGDLDGDLAGARFPISNGKDFAPGNTLDLSLGYDGVVSLVHSGVIVSQTIQVSNGCPARLIVESVGSGIVPAETASAPALLLAIGDSVIEADVTIEGARPTAQRRGTVKFQGSALAKAGGSVTLAGLGDRCDGDVVVSGVTHVAADGNWTTTVELGKVA
jgi:phage protein D